MGIAISPDGMRYMAMARGERVPMPFHLRWLLPKLLGDDVRKWHIASIAGWIVFVVGTGVWGGWPAALLVAGLSGPALIFRYPVLVEGVGLGIAILITMQSNVAAIIVLSIIGGMVSERVPIFAALWAWSPWALVGLLSPLLRWALYRPGPEVTDLVGTPAAAVVHKPWRIAGWRQWHDTNLILPWGGFMPAVIYADIHMAATLAVSYAQLAVATDSIRLYQWAAPVLAIALVEHIDWRIILVLALFTWFNPRRGDGV